MTGAQALEVEYLGWSGLRMSGPCGDIWIDPPEGTPFPLDRMVNVLITHGHPEHVGGSLAHLRNPARSGAVRGAAAEPVCRYLSRHATRADDRFDACAPGQRFDMAGFAIDVFEWKHMPLLPPGIGPALHHLTMIATRPRLAARIVIAALRGPWPFPMLGFRLAAPGCPRVLVYGEGLHRCSSGAELERIRAVVPADLLLAAVEPEDTDVLPELFRRLGAPAVGLYEAHRPWREAFGMPLADLDALAATVARGGMRAMILRPGTAVPVPGQSPFSGARAAAART
jgi:hypothetical protein